MTVYLSINTHPPKKNKKHKNIFKGSCQSFVGQLQRFFLGIVVSCCMICCVICLLFNIIWQVRYGMLHVSLCPPKNSSTKRIGGGEGNCQNCSMIIFTAIVPVTPPKYSFLNPEKIWKIGGDDFVWGCLLYNNQFHNVWQVFYMSSPQKSFWHLHTCPGVGIGKVFNHTQQFF